MATDRVNHPVPALETHPPLARGIWLVALAGLAIHLVGLTQYGWFRDELYYLSCAKRLAWGYVDQPPFSILVLALVRAVAGDSLFALRLVAAVAAAALAPLTGMIARELGGRRGAQMVAAIAAAIAPEFLGAGRDFSMNVFDFLFWGVATLLALRAFDRGGSARWLALGVVLGLGLLNKWSVAWLGGGLFAALVLPRARSRLLTPGPWLAAGIAALLFLPHVLWEVRHGWPTLEFMHNARVHKMAALEPMKFILDLVLTLNPGSAPLWVAGLVASLARARWRPVALIFLVTLAILFTGSARVEYLTLATPALFAAGAVWWESRTRAGLAIVAVLVVALGVPLIPFALPVLPVQRFIAYQTRLGLKPATEERHRMGALPQHYADMFGWPELADSVARAAALLTPEERARAIVVVDNYGDAGALERFGAGRLPTIACQHNNWYLWGPPAWDGKVAIFVGRDSAEVASEFDQVRVVGVAGHPLAMPYERDLPITIARGFRPDFKTAWVRGKHWS